MQTRSQLKNNYKQQDNPEKYSFKEYKYDVNIDFDDASAAWKANKKSKGNGTYRYICQAITKLGKKCLREPINCRDYCKIHNKTISLT